MRHLSAAELDDGLASVRLSPSDDGHLALIVCRPGIDQRKLLAEAILDTDEGVVGDSWKRRGTRDRPAKLDAQVTIMNARVAALVAGEGDRRQLPRDGDRRQLAGDQLYIDLDISQSNLPPGTLLSIGSAVIEVSARPHLGCKKFAARFGEDALDFVNSPLGRELRLRGANTRIVKPGSICVGDRVSKIQQPSAC